MLTTYKKLITKQIKNVTSLPEELTEFMSNKSNWLKVDSDSCFGESALLSYPDHIYVLSEKKASESVLALLNSFQNKYKGSEYIKFANFEVDEAELEEEELDDLHENVNFHSIFAYVYEKTEDESVNEEFFNQEEQVYIFNFLDFDKEEEIQELENTAINLTEYDNF